MYGPEGAVLGSTTTVVSAATLANTGVSSLLSVIAGTALIAGVFITFRALTAK